MPPPIQTQSGSRAALVTWTVISSILFVVATVLAIFSSVAANKAELEKQTQANTFGQVVSANDLRGTTITELNAARETLKLPNGTTLLNVAVAQRDGLARKIATGGDATAAADKALGIAKGAHKGGTPGTLSDAVTALAGDVKAKDAQLASQDTRYKDLEGQIKQLQDNAKRASDAYNGSVAKLNTQIKDLSTQNEAYRGQKDVSVGDIQTSFNTSLSEAVARADQLEKDKTQAEDDGKKLQKQIQALQGKLSSFRQPVDQIARQPDAHIMRVAGDGILYIDLGSNDHVSNGMSFEVYDRVLGIPKVGDSNTDENLPKGKASIEIIKISPGSSECRIVRQTPGETVGEGDICVNLVYDRNVKYNILVYGDFDLHRTGTANPADTDVIKRLVTTWGGKVIDKLDANTDFLVIGKSPEIPSYTPEELDRPEIQFKVEELKKQIAAYDELLSQAVQYNIPVLNQNRFLYFTGYYEQSAR